MFQPTSRYYALPVAEYVDPDGRTIRYVTRRIIARGAVVPLAEHRVTAGDRLDRLTARYLGDPEQFWRIADANPCERADDLTEHPGDVVIVPMPALRSP